MDEPFPVDRMRGFVVKLGAILLPVLSSAHAGTPELRYPDREDIPAWWQQTRAIYCPWDNSGAGSSLMKYRTHRDEGFETFADLDRVLDDAEALGTNVLYLVGYWNPGYEHKSDYEPKLAWGGKDAFRAGIEKVHQRGGRVILYLEALIASRMTSLMRVDDELAEGLDDGRISAKLREAFAEEGMALSDAARVTVEQKDRRWLISDGDERFHLHREEHKGKPKVKVVRENPLGRLKGSEWAMQDAGGGYYSYYGTGDRFYVMYPGPGSRWADHIVGVAGRLAREYRIDGIHLDSYGVHLDHVKPDHNPHHPQGKDTEVFHRAAVDLVRRMRAEIRKHVPDAVVILEGAERTDLLEVCDGAQFECLSKLENKPWYGRRRYPIFTSSFSLEEMQAILDAGHNLALSPWWFRDEPRGRDEKRLRNETDKSSRFDQLESLHLYHNILYANDLLPEPRLQADFDALDKGIIEYLNQHGWGSEFKFPPLVRVANRYLHIYEKHEDELDRGPADVIREMVRKATRGAP